MLIPLYEIRLRGLIKNLKANREYYNEDGKHDKKNRY